MSLAHLSEAVAASEGPEPGPAASYMSEHDLVPLLELSLLATCKEYQQKTRPLCANAQQSPTAFIATWLLRNNPRHSELARARLDDYIASRPDLTSVEPDSVALMTEEEAAAAATLQAYARGRGQRRKSREAAAATRLQSTRRGIAQRRAQQAQSQAAVKLQAIQRGNRARRPESAPVPQSRVGDVGAAPYEEANEDETAAVAKLQASCRGRQARRELAAESEAATRIQSARRGAEARRARE